MRNLATVVALLAASGGGAFELSSTTDIRAQFTGLSYPQAASVPLTYKGPDYLLNGQVGIDWNLRAQVLPALDVELRYGLSVDSELDRSGQVRPEGQGADYRLDDLPTTIQPEYQQRLDRFNLRWYGPVGDYVLGRQAISFGQARVFSPVDVIQPAQVTDFSSAYRAGVDALRGTWLLGAVSELDVGYVFGRDKVAFVRLKAYLASVDWELIGLQINDDHRLVSLGSTAGIGTLGLWQESAWLDGPDGEGTRMTLGADTTWFDDLYVFSEVHYNGLGGAGTYSQVTADSWYQLGAVQPLGTWYLSLQAQYPLNVVTQLSVGTTSNLNDGSTLINSGVTIDASQTLSVSVQTIVPVASKADLDYEYGVYPFAAEASLDWTF